jgi:hypothetical protein
MHTISNRHYDFIKEVMNEYIREHINDEDLRTYNRARRAVLLMRALKNKENRNNK